MLRQFRHKRPDVLQPATDNDLKLPRDHSGIQQ